MSNLPTKEQEEWLKEYHRTFSRYHIAVKLGISEKRLSEWLGHLGLKKKKEGRKTTLSDTDKQFIKDNFHSMKHETIATKLGVTASAVRMYCFRNNFKKTGQEKYNPPPKQIIPFDPKGRTFQRPAAKYDNENIIEKYLNMDL